VVQAISSTTASRLVSGVPRQYRAGRRQRCGSGEADPHVPEPLNGNIAVRDSKLSDLRSVTSLAVLPGENQKNRSLCLQCYGVAAQNDWTEPMVETEGYL
jgi:hypothetical protein